MLQPTVKFWKIQVQIDVLHIVMKFYSFNVYTKSEVIFQVAFMVLCVHRQDMNEMCHTL